MTYGVPIDLRGVGSVSRGGYMRTETGYGSMSSFESMSATLPPEHWGLETESMHERNYPCHTHIHSYFGPNVSLSGVGAAAFRKQLYLCMLAQGFERKAWIEAWRSSNVWGLLMWQLNEIWPTGGWGSIEYGTAAAKGQVIGGRWKILHNFMRQSSFVDVFVGCGIATRNPEASIQTADSESIGGSSPLCYLRNDMPDRFVGTVTVSLIALGTGKITPLTTIAASVAAIGDAVEGSAQLFCPDGKALLGPNVSSATECGTFTSLLQSVPECDPTSCYIDVRVEPAVLDGVSPSNSTGSLPLYGHNELLLAAPLQLKLQPITVEAVVAPDVRTDSSVAVTLTADRVGVAAYVWLSTLAAGRFEPNGFMMGAGNRQMVVRFVPFGQQPTDVPTLRASIRVEHLGEHLD
jgi:beta-mannosidase